MVDIGYARVSTEDQNPKLQLDALKAAGCVIRQEIRSGKAGASRPVRDAVLKELHAGDRLTVWKLDRLGRSVIELNAIISDLKKRGVAFRSLTDPIDTSTANGELLFQILAAFAQFERAIIIERTKAGLAARKADGLQPGGTSPFGFEADYTTVNDDEAALLKDATDQILSDPKHRLSTVVDKWNADGVRTRDGEHWHVTSLRRQLMNPRVVAIIGQDDYDALGRLFTAPERQKQGRPAQHLLSGILKCATCEEAMYAKHPGHGDAMVYACRKGSTSGGRFRGCGQMSINYDQADQWMTDAFVVAATSPMLPELIARHSDAGMEELSSALAADRHELEELAHLKGEGRFTIPEWLALRDPIEARIQEAKAKLAASSTDDVAALRSLPRAAGALRVLWDSWDVPTRRVWLRRLLERVVVKHGAERGAPMKERLDPEWKR